MMNTITISESIAIKYLRAIATVLIVACHYSQALNNQWADVFDIGVQLFFVMSGYLYGFKQIEHWDSFFFKRWEKLYIPYIVFFMLLICALHFFHVERIRLEDVIKTIYLCHGYIGNAFNGAGQLWFITAIFACYWITPLLQKVTSGSGRLNGTLLIVLGVVSFLLFLFGGQSSPIARWYSWFFNYTVGYLLSRSKETIKYAYLILCVGFLIYLLSTIMWSDIADWNSFVNISFHSFASHIIFLIFILGSKVLKPTKVLKVFGIIEVYSYYIYFVHYPFILGSWSFVGITKCMVLDILLLIMIIAISTTVLAYLCKYVEKALDWILNSNNI